MGFSLLGFYTCPLTPCKITRRAIHELSHRVAAPDLDRVLHIVKIASLIHQTERIKIKCCIIFQPIPSGNHLKPEMSVSTVGRRKILSSSPLVGGGKQRQQRQQSPFQPAPEPIQLSPERALTEVQPPPLSPRPGRMRLYYRHLPLRLAVGEVRSVQRLVWTIKRENKWDYSNGSRLKTYQIQIDFFFFFNSVLKKYELINKNVSFT